MIDFRWIKFDNWDTYEKWLEFRVDGGQWTRIPTVDFWIAYPDGLDNTDNL